MALQPPPNSIPNNPFQGPDNEDPLTSKELIILLAIPRAAQTSPDALAFRLPLGPNPAQGSIDVTFSQACAIVSRLASIWKSRLDALLVKTNTGTSSAGPGTTICMFVQPGVHAIFHHLAFRALGCTMQYVYSYLSHDVIFSMLGESNCDAVLHSGMGDAWVNAMRVHFGEKLVALPPQEFAHQLARNEKEGYAEPTPPWPEPRRPTPALILHSSGTTGVVKLLRFSLFWYTLALPADNVKGVSIVRSSEMTHTNVKSPKTYPHLIFSPPFWGSYHSSLVIRLATAAPVTFCHLEDAGNLPPKQLIPWARALDVGSITCSPCFLYELSLEEFQAQVEFLGSLNSIALVGRPLDHQMSVLFEKYQLPIRNIYGSSEFGACLFARTPPYTHLRPGLREPPLVLPISDYDSDGSRQVQLWRALSTTPRLAHLYARGGVPIKLEPFPGEGPHKGELAFNTHDIFQEVRDGQSGLAYISLGRGDDMIRLAGYGQMNASRFEAELISMFYARRNEGLGRNWTIDTVQLFGNALPYTALVVQLRRSTQGEGTLEQGVLDELYEVVEQVNEEMRLIQTRVDPKKRMLVITSEGGAYGPNVEVARGHQLEVTHKYSLQRWKNVQNFKAWLDSLNEG